MLTKKLRTGLSFCVLATVLGASGRAHANPLTTDGDFGSQAVGSAPTSPWNNPTAGTTTTVANSPYTNVFGVNNKSLNDPSTPANTTYFVQQFTPILSTSTAPLYLNVDFQNTSADTGSYSIVATSGADGSKVAAGLAITGSQLFAVSSGGNGDAIPITLQTGQWYNVQLALDMADHTYSGTISTATSSVAISSRSFVTQNDISGIFSDLGTFHTGDADPSHNIDNFVLSDTPFAAVPEPASLAILALGSLGLIARRRRA